MTKASWLKPTDTVFRGQDQVSAEIDGQAMIMSIEKGEYYGLDEIGSRIWTLIETPHTVDAICVKLLEEYDVNREICENQVIEFLENLLNTGLVARDQ